MKLVTDISPDHVIGRNLDATETLIDQGVLKEFPRPRKASGTGGLKKTAIAEERIAFAWAVFAFLQRSWSEIAEEYPKPGGWSKNVVVAAKQKRERADQIRKRVQGVLKDLGLRR